MQSLEKSPKTKANFLPHGSSFLPFDIKLKNVRFTKQRMELLLTDGRKLTVPLKWFPKLAKAEPKELKNWEFCAGGRGVHWELLDEDISLKVC